MIGSYAAIYVLVTNIAVKEACELYVEEKRQISIWPKVTQVVK